MRLPGDGIVCGSVLEEGEVEDCFNNNNNNTFNLEAPFKTPKVTLQSI